METVISTSPMKNPRLPAAIALVALAAFVLSPAWPAYIDVAMRHVLLPLGVGKLSVWAGTAVAAAAIFSPIAVAGYAVAFYVRRNEARLQSSNVRERVERMSAAIASMEEAARELARLSQQVQAKSEQLAEVEGRLRALRSLRDEEASLAQEKLRLLTHRPIWPLVLSHLAAVLAGVLGNAVTDVLKLHSIWPA